MFCIPLNNWLEKTSETAYFGDFNLSASPKLLNQLKESLSFFDIRATSQNCLSLKQQANSNNNEEYTLTISKSHINITSPSVKGLHNGLCTLKLLLAFGKKAINIGCIKDAPLFASRGIMLDVSRGKMPTINYLKNLVGLMSDLKYNVLQLYCEDKLALSKHPKIGKITGVYTKKQITDLDHFCRTKFVELQPCIQTYSHMHGVLRTAGYSNLAENSGLFSLAAGKKQVYDFLEDTFSETLPWFSSKTLNINMDEAYDIGTGFSKKAVKKSGKSKVFITHIKKVIEIARKNGAQKILLWGDVAQKYPDLLKELPKNTVVADWNYNPQKTYPSLEVFKKTKFPFWATGGVSSWNSIFPRVYSSYTNLIGYSTQALKHGACGFLVSDWGDYGHFQPLGLSLYGYIIGAQQAFSPCPISPKKIEKEAFPLMFFDIRTKKAFKLLMNSNLATGVQTGFKSMSIYYFFDDMLNGLAMNGNEKYPKLERESFDVFLKNGAKAYNILKCIQKDPQIYEGFFPDKNWENLFGCPFIAELLLSAQMTKFIGAKGQLAFKIRDGLKNKKLKPDDFLEWICEIKLLYKEFISIRKNFETVWQLRANEAGIENCLSLFDKAGLQMAETAKWLAKKMLDIMENKNPNLDISAYTPAKRYTVLWTSDFKNMWDRAYPWQ